MHKTWIAPLAAALMLAFGAAHAAGDDSDIANAIVNNPGVANWNVYGLSQPPAPHPDVTVQGGQALRVAADKGVDAWAVGAQMATAKPVKSGDTLLLAVWLRAEALPDGQAYAQVPIFLQQAGAPYTPVAQSNVEVTGKWQMFYAAAVAAQDWPKGKLGVSVQLAGAKQTIDLGPAFVLDFGPNYDRSKLPQNPLADAPPPQAGNAQPFDEQAAAAPFAADIAAIRKLLPVPGHLINDPAIAASRAYGPNQHNEIVAAPGIAGGKALRVHVEKAAGDAWAVGVSTPIRGDIRKGDTVLIAFRANARAVENEGQSGVIATISVQQNAPPWDSAASTAALVPLNAWRTFYAAGVAQEDIPAGHAILTAQFGSTRQVLDFAPSFVLDLGPDIPFKSLPQNRITYPGRADNAPWRAAAAARIRQYRTGDFHVVVTDAAGKPVPGASVHFAMQKHLFHFGTFVGHNLANATGPDADKIRAVFLKSFNFATTPIYWQDFGWGNPTWRANYIASMKWLHDHDIAFRAHPIVYPREDLTPSYVKVHAGDPKAAAEAVLDHVRDVVPYLVQYGACCADAVNEPRDGTYLPSIAGPDIFAKVFETAHALAPDLRLFVNDYDIISAGGENRKALDFYHHWISDALAKGVPLGGIGIQGHFGASLTDPARVVAVLDDFSQYHLPIEITEFDVDTSDEQTQADYTRDMLTAAFSEPAVDAFVTWGFWEGDHWRPSAAMLRRDWSEKPNYKAWMQRIYHDWWTDETVLSGKDGGATARAYYGDYKITVTAGGRSVEKDVSFAAGAAPVRITVN